MNHKKKNMDDFTCKRLDIPHKRLSSLSEQVGGGSRKTSHSTSRWKGYRYVIQVPHMSELTAVQEDAVVWLNMIKSGSMTEKKHLSYSLWMFLEVVVVFLDNSYFKDEVDG